MQKSILIIEQNPHFCDALMEQLQEDYNAVNATTQDKALAVADAMKPQIVIMDDVKLQEKITDILPNVHIISLKKPFHINELLKLLETEPQSYASMQCQFTIGKHIFFPAMKKLQTPNDETVYLTDKEAVLLNYLCGYVNKLVPRQDLLKEIWGYQDDMETHTLETHIYRLRQKLGDDDGACLTTEEGGYCLTATASKTDA